MELREALVRLGIPHEQNAAGVLVAKVTQLKAQYDVPAHSCEVAVWALSIWKNLNGKHPFVVAWEDQRLAIDLTGKWVKTADKKLTANQLIMIQRPPQPNMPGGLLWKHSLFLGFLGFDMERLLDQVGPPADDSEAVVTVKVDQVLQPTAKAFQLVVQGMKIWVPKSACQVNDNWLHAPAWMLKAKGVKV